MRHVLHGYLAITILSPVLCHEKDRPKRTPRADSCRCLVAMYIQRSYVFFCNERNIFSSNALKFCSLNPRYEGSASSLACLRGYFSGKLRNRELGNFKRFPYQDPYLDECGSALCRRLISQFPTFVCGTMFTSIITTSIALQQFVDYSKSILMSYPFSRLDDSIIDAGVTFLSSKLCTKHPDMTYHAYLLHGTSTNF